MKTLQFNQPDTAVFVAHVTQFVLPHGERRELSTALPLSIKPQYDEMISRGCRFEAEILTTGQVSCTITHPGAGDLDFSITPNGPEVQLGMVKLLLGPWRKNLNDYIEAELK